MQNHLLTNPLKVVIIDPMIDITRRAYVFLGDVPKGISNAAHEYLNARPDQRKHYDSLLKDYYGSDYKKKLGLDITDAKTAWMYSHDRTIIGNEEESATHEIDNFWSAEAYSRAINTAVVQEIVFDDLIFTENLPTEIPLVVAGEGNKLTVVAGANHIWDLITNGFDRGEIAVILEGTSLEHNEIESDLRQSNDVYGGRLNHSDGDEDDIEFLLENVIAEEKTEEITSGIEYVDNIHLFPEDKFSELKEKIYLATGIPAYRQHMFFINQKKAFPVYEIYADGEWLIDIRNINRFESHVLGIPVDKLLYDKRNIMKVDALDPFTLLLNLPSDVLYICDLGQFTRRIRSQLTEILSDTYQFELLYYGFVVKYWPQLLPECFYDYIKNESELQHKYPDLAKPRSILGGIYRAEANIINAMYRNSVKFTADITIAITSMVAVIEGKAQLSIRNLFDRLRVTKCIPEIHSYVEHDGKKYLLRKRHAKNGSDIHFPTGITMKTGITIAISLKKSDQESFHSRGVSNVSAVEQSRYMFLNIWSNGKYHIRTVWNEEDELGFDEINKTMKTFTTPIINAINSMGKYIFTDGQLQLITKYNLSFQNLNVCVFWKKVMMETTFKAVKLLWEQYMRARIIGPRNVQQYDKYEFLFRKGIHEFDTTAIDRIVSASNNRLLTNQYQYLSNNMVKQKWDQNYDGRIVRMTHRTTDIRFEIADIRQHEFDIFMHHINGFVYNASTNASIKAASVPRDYKNVKKLRKLREQDPELFNLKKHGSKRTYSRECQRRKQPLIYTPEEMRGIDTRGLTKYWNFTLNRPAFYGCPDRKYPHLSFIVGVHPKGYCLPCCTKKSQTTEDSKKTRVNTVCLRDHKYFDDSETKSRHVMAYGKEIDPHRLSKLPGGVTKNLLFNTLPSNQNYYLYGVPQNVPSTQCGLIFALAEALNMPMIELAEKFARDLKSYGSVFSTLLGGSLGESFASISAVSDAITDTFIKLNPLSAKHFRQWPELIIELAKMILGVTIYTLIDATGDGNNIQLYVGDRILADTLADVPSGKSVVVVRQKNRYYPIFAIVDDRHFRVMQIASRTFHENDKIVKLLVGMIKHRSGGIGTEKLLDLTTIIEFCSVTNWKLMIKYINKQNLCYAVRLENSGGGVYCTIDYSSHISDGIKITFEALSASDCKKISLHDCERFMTDINQFLSQHVLSYQTLVPKELIGMRIEDTIIPFSVMTTCGLVMYFHQLGDPKIFKDIPTREILYDPRDVNRQIVSRQPPSVDARSTRIGSALYNNYLYQLFLIEFVNFLGRERDDKRRAELEKLIRETNFRRDLTHFRQTISTLITDPGDQTLFWTIMYTFSHNYDKEYLLYEINSTTFHFDKITMNKIMAAEDKHTILRDIASKFTVQRDFDTTGIKFPNIYVPCTDMQEKSGYCDGKKLVVNRSIDELVDLLRADLENELTSRYLLSGETMMDYLTFTKNPMEIVTVYRL